MSNRGGCYNYVGDGTEVHFPLDPDLTRAADHPIMPPLALSEGFGSFVKNPMSVVAEGLPSIPTKLLDKFSTGST